MPTVGLPDDAAIVIGVDDRRRWGLGNKPRQALRCAMNHLAHLTGRAFNGCATIEHAFSLLTRLVGPAVGVQTKIWPALPRTRANFANVTLKAGAIIVDTHTVNANLIERTTDSCAGGDALTISTELSL